MLKCQKYFSSKLTKNSAEKRNKNLEERGHFLTVLTTQCGVDVDLDTQYNSYRNPKK